MAFTPYVAALSLLPLALTVLLRRWDAAVVAALTVAILAACVLPRWIAQSDALAGAKGAELRILTANLRVGGGDVETLARIIRDERVDVVVLQEVTPKFVARAGELMPYRVVYPQVGVGGSAIYSRLPLRDDGVRWNPVEFGQAKAELTGLGVLIESVHTVAPSERDRVAGWRESFANEPSATVDGPIRILAGDFNATLDHSLVRELIATGYRDAANVVGKGFDTTWGPYDGDPIPPVTLDRVLADRRVGVVATRVFGLPNSDHRAMLAVLKLP
jgi:endonuclease/exonuclease/phosphatase (EEP) superfamily protein YafD